MSNFLAVFQSKSKSTFLNYWNYKVMEVCLNFTKNLKATSAHTFLDPFPLFLFHPLQPNPSYSSAGAWLGGGGGVLVTQQGPRGSYFLLTLHSYSESSMAQFPSTRQKNQTHCFFLNSLSDCRSIDLAWLCIPRKSLYCPHDSFVIFGPFYTLSCPFMYMYVDFLGRVGQAP